MIKFNPVLRSGILASCAFFSSVAIPANAQAPQAATSNAQALDFMNQYRQSIPGAVKNQELLIGAIKNKLANTEQNYNLVRDSLNKARTPEEKSLLLRLLSSMYVPKERNARNLSIEADIKGAIGSADSSVAKNAVLEYSRLAYPPDRHQVLILARQSKIIGDDEYFGELAHGLRFLSASEQGGTLKEISASNNKFSIEILADIFTNATFVGQLSDSSRRDLLTIFSKNEPQFPLALDRFGLLDAVKYSTWIGAYATIQSSLTDRKYADVVIEKLSIEKTDPRKIMAVFIDNSGRRIIAESTDKNRLESLLKICKSYSDSLPQNQMLKDATNSFTALLASKSW